MSLLDPDKHVPTVTPSTLLLADVVRAQYEQLADPGNDLKATRLKVRRDVYATHVKYYGHESTIDADLQAVGERLARVLRIWKRTVDSESDNGDLTIVRYEFAAWAAKNLGWTREETDAWLRERHERNMLQPS